MADMRRNHVGIFKRHYTSQYSGFTQCCKMLSVHYRACSTLSLENLTGEGEWHASRLELY